MAWKEQTGEHTWRVRYYHDGAVFTVPEKFPTEQDALNYIADMASDQRRGRWIDPAEGRMTLGEWAARWMEALDVEDRTEENYRGLLRNQILPRWAHTAIGDIKALDVAKWRKELRGHYAPSTVNGVLGLLSMMLEDAVDERMIEANPVHRKRRRGRRRDHAPSRLEKVWALPEEVVRIAIQASMLSGPMAYLLVVMTAWTGCRWGEITGLQRDRVDLRRGVIRIDPEIGCLHESAHGLWLGPPKTPSSARTTQLPPFLTDLLRKHLAQHTSPFVFTAPHGGWLRRSDFNRRVFRPSVDGDLKRGLDPVKPGLCFHGLRHSHKTWLSTDHVPEIACAKRMGHHVSDKLEEVYTHVAPKMEREILILLQRLWKHAQHAAIRPVDNRPKTRHDSVAPRSRARGTHTQPSPTLAGSPAMSSAPSSPAETRRSRPGKARSAVPQASARAVPVAASRAHHRAAALRSAPGKSRALAASQVAAPALDTPGAAKGMIILQKRSSNPPERDHELQPMSIIKRMKKALRPARLLRSKSFDQEWS